MTLARATISGTVYRAPEKRFTSNNVPITSFTININKEDETLIRVIAKGNLADTIANDIAVGDNVVVEGRLQNATVKTDDGAERKIVEIDASSLEKIVAGNAFSSDKPVNSKAKFAEKENIVEFQDDKPDENLIGEDEIPF